MDYTNGKLLCPACKRALEQVNSERFHCTEHGEWAAYGPKLLVQAPTLEEKRHPRLSLPWEPSARRL